MKNLNFLHLIAVVLLMAVTHLGMNAASRIHGDVNGDGYANITDVTELINLLLQDGINPQIQSRADINVDGVVNISDVIVLINQILDDHVLTPETETITVNGVSFTMVHVEGGTFLMGAIPEEYVYARRNESPAHNVTLSGYYIGQTEVTWELWNAVMESEVQDYSMDPQCPVVKVNLFDCARFVDKLTELTGKVFRMPTEAEWEYAARGGSNGLRYRFAGSDDIDEVGWCLENSGGMVHHVAGKMPNPLGLYDMTGNVNEWCQDWYGGYTYDAQVNPVGPESGYITIIRGGAYDISFEGCHVTFRHYDYPTERQEDLGFRIVMNE